MTAIIAFIKGLSIFAKISGALGGIGGTLGGLATFGWLGPAAPFVLGFFKIVGTLIKWVWEGIENCITHPATLTIVVGGIVFGVWLGVCWDEHEVTVARAQVASLKTGINEANNGEKLRASGAIAARDTAEAQPITAIITTSLPEAAAVPAKPAAAPAAKPAGVRKSNRRREAESHVGVLGF